jgi:hypothetical protein
MASSLSPKRPTLLKVECYAMQKKKTTSFLSTPQLWSNPMNEVFNAEVNTPVLKHAKSTTGTDNKLMGFPFDFVRTEIIESGRADFSSSYIHEDYGTLSSVEVALLYCFVNMKKHFYSSYANFRLSEQRLTELFDEHDQVVLIDIGCGPATSGLAFAELFKGRQFKYYGIDRSVAMRNKARSMMRAGKKHGLVHKATSVVCHESWNNVGHEFGENSAVVINFSFFFASPFLKSKDISELADFYFSIRHSGDSNVQISYTNSVKDEASESYKRFISRLGLRYEDQPPQREKVIFRKSPGRAQLGEEIFLREIYEVAYQ